MKTLIILLIVIFSCYNSVIAQVTIETPSKEEDTIRSKNIIPYEDKLTVRYIIANKALRLNIRGRGDKSRIVEYEPYGTGFTGAGFFYKKIGLEALLRVPVRTAGNFGMYGKTKSFDFQMNRYGRKLGIDLLVQRYKGFHIGNSQSLYDNRKPSEAFPHRGDLLAWNIGANVYYIFNHRGFSLRASFIQKERQLASDGSFVLMASLFRVSQDADSSIVPRDTDIDFTPNSYYEKGHYYSFGMLPGYAHTFIADRFYLTLSLLLGPGLQKQQFEADGNKKNNYGIELKSNIRSALGYNGKKGFLGVSFVADNSTFKVYDLRVTTKSSNFKIYAGMRL